MGSRETFNDLAVQVRRTIFTSERYRLGNDQPLTRSERKLVIRTLLEGSSSIGHYFDTGVSEVSEVREWLRLDYLGLWSAYHIRINSVDLQYRTDDDLAELCHG